MDSDAFDVTAPGLAADAGVDAESVRLYGRLKLIEFRELRSGVRLYRSADAPRVRELRDARRRLGPGNRWVKK